MYLFWKKWKTFYSIWTQINRFVVSILFPLCFNLPRVNWTEEESRKSREREKEGEQWVNVWVAGYTSLCPALQKISVTSAADAATNESKHLFIVENKNEAAIAYRWHTANVHRTGQQSSTCGVRVCEYSGRRTTEIKELFHAFSAFSLIVQLAFHLARAMLGAHKSGGMENQYRKWENIQLLVFVYVRGPLCCMRVLHHHHCWRTNHLWASGQSVYVCVWVRVSRTGLASLKPKPCWFAKQFESKHRIFNIQNWNRRVSIVQKVPLRALPTWNVWWSCHMIQIDECTQ